jgi:hypothetical protein
MNPFRYFVSVTMDDNDRRMLIILLVILLVLFVVVGLLGMAIRKICQIQAKVISQEMGDAVRYKVVSDPVHFKKLATKKNNRLLFKKSIAPIAIGLVSLVFYIVYAGVTKGWTHNYWSDFSTMLFIWDFDNATYVNFWGFNHALASWPPLLHGPIPEAQYWASYILCPLWVIAIVYYLVVIQGYFSRFVYLRHLAKTVYNKGLEDYKYYDNLGTDAYGRPLNPTETPTSAPGSFPPPNVPPKR